MVYGDGVSVRMVFSGSFRSWFERLVALDEALARELAADLAYLAEHGRAAALPSVRHRIQGSRHYPDMSEIRTRHNDGPGPVLRVLVVFHAQDTAVVVLVGGDKQRLGNAWYDQAIPLADHMYDRYKEANP